MTVTELIAVLQTMPGDTPVIYRYASEYEVLDPVQVELFTAADQKIILHHGRYMRVYPDWIPPDTVLQWVTVCALPGN